MKNILTLIVITFLAISCNEVNSGRDDVARKFIDEFVVRDNQWTEVSEPNGSNPHLIHTRTFPALDRNVVDNGIVLGYVERNGLYYPLQTTSWFETSFDLWEESIGFGYRQNELVLLFKASDFNYNDPLSPMRFKFVLIW